MLSDILKLYLFPEREFNTGSEPKLPNLTVSESVAEVTVMAGDSADLPCQTVISSREAADKDRLKLVLWFRNMSDTPFYT